MSSTKQVYRTWTIRVSEKVFHPLKFIRLISMRMHSIDLHTTNLTRTIHSFCEFIWSHWKWENWNVYLKEKNTQKQENHVSIRNEEKKHEQMRKTWKFRWYSNFSCMFWVWVRRPDWIRFAIDCFVYVIECVQQAHDERTAASTEWHDLSAAERRRNDQTIVVVHSLFFLVLHFQQTKKKWRRRPKTQL